MPLRFLIPTGKVQGAVYLLPGLHFQGADHPEIERFSRILVEAGIVVASPDIEDYLAMHFNPRAIDDAEAGFKAFANHPLVRSFRPCVMSISLGSRLALGVCARNQNAVGSLITFGAYQDWRKALFFCLAGKDDRKHDPLNRPIIFTALQDQLPDLPEKEAIVQAWLDFVHTTWGQDKFKNKPAMTPIAEEIGKHFVGPARQLFLQGLGLATDGDEIITNGLESGTKLDWLEIRDDLQALSCPLLALHARQDDVIECEQSLSLEAQAPTAIRSEVILTGMYSHSGRKLPSPRHLMKELSQLITIVSRLTALTSLSDDIRKDD